MKPRPGPPARRAVKVSDDQSAVQSWVTVVAIVALIAVGGLLFKNRERFFPAQATPRPVPARLSEEAEGKFYEARDRIVAGKFGEASAILSALDTDRTPQPARNWMTLQNGLARLLDGRLPEARTEFARLAQRGPFSRDMNEEKLAQFFVKVGQLASSEEPVKAEAARDFDAESVEAVAFLIFGAKDWALGQFEDASSFLREFRSATPPETEVWLRRYRPLAEGYAESYAAFSAAVDEAKDAGTIERKRGVLAVIAKAKEKVKRQPELVAKLSAIETDLQAQVDAVDAEARAATMAAEAADQKIIDDVKARVTQYNRKLQFADAHQIVFTATVDGDKAKAELDRWLKRTAWLAKFKANLIDDISASGYAKPLTKKDGTPVVGALKAADDSQVTTINKVAVPWTDFTPDTLLAMANDFLAKIKDPAAVAERKWAAGNFLYEMGRKPAALALLREAAQGRPEYQSALPLFPE